MDILMKKFSQFISEQEEISIEDILNEGVNDPAIFKAVFLAGGPGSGKSFIVGKTALAPLGYRVVNSDDAFENAMKKAGLEMSSDNIFSVQGQELRGKAVKLTGTKQSLYLKGRLGIVIDGTGKDPEKILNQKKKLESMGYETSMIFVNTNIDTAIARDAARQRTVGKDAVTTMWSAVQDNIGRFQTMFGKKNFYVVDNSEGRDFEKETRSAYVGISKWTKIPPSSKLAKKWIDQEKANKTK
jgi:shikimate kinase